MKIISVVGARPNFMKIAPFIKAIEKHNAITQNKMEHILIHMGQHYDDRMSQAFFEDLGIPMADINLGIGSGSHAEQVGNTMISFERVLETEKPDWVVVVGDVNATLACCVAAQKMHIKVCHIEAGLRSGNMRENRKLQQCLIFIKVCNTDLTTKCRILSFYSAYSFVVVSALTIINFEIAMRHFKVQLV